MKTEGNKIHILDETNKKKEEKFINTIQREKKNKGIVNLLLFFDFIN